MVPLSQLVAEMWDYILYSMNAPFGSTRGTNLKMCNRTKSIVRGVGSSQELARTVRSSSKVSNPLFQPLIGSQEPTPQVLVPVINIPDRLAFPPGVSLSDRDGSRL